MGKHKQLMLSCHHYLKLDGPVYNDYCASLGRILLNSSKTYKINF